MNHLRTYFCISILSLLVCMPVTAQEAAQSDKPLQVRITWAGAVATGDNTPFWQTSNRYGIVPAEANNTYLQAGLFYRQQRDNGLSWGAALDLVGVTPRYRNAYIHQLYAEVGYKSLHLSLGSREQQSAFGLDSRLSSGDVIYSTNARPLPEVRLSFPHYTVVPCSKDWLQIKWHFAVGRSFDNAYLQEWTQGARTFVEDVLWHHKALHFRIMDTRRQFPLYAEFGVQHIAQWGGTSTNPKVGTQPHSFKDFLRIVGGQRGGDDASLSDQINVLGSHHISFDFRLGFRQTDWQLQAYYQHLCYDKSGIEFYNGTDGLWGLQLDLPQFPWMKRIVVEYFTTMNASGPFHFIRFDHEKHPGRGGGGDNYYNNEEYVSGNSYFNRGIGSPLIPSPVYNEGGRLGFYDNRVRAWHIGLGGTCSPRLSYRALCSVMQGWGTAYRPFMSRRTTVSPMVELTYNHPHLSGWLFTGSVAGDTGDLFGDSTFGVSLAVTKRF
ncbi:MAG: capsule assembly Wzi family protein [Parabacteroides sp.]